MEICKTVVSVSSLPTSVPLGLIPDRLPVHGQHLLGPDVVGVVGRAVLVGSDVSAVIEFISFLYVSAFIELFNIVCISGRKK